MLTPLNSVEVNTLLNQLPQRAELTKEVHPLLHGLQHVIDLLLGRKATNTEPDTAVGTLVAVAQCTKNVTGLEGGRRASTAGRKSDVLQGHEQRLALNIRKGDIDTSRVEVLRVTILGRMLQSQEAVEKSVGEVLDALRIVLLKLSANATPKSSTDKMVLNG